MERLRGFPRRFRFPWRSRARIQRDVEDELAFHLAERTKALQREGLSAEDARAEALQQFGDIDAARKQLVADDVRGERHSRWRTMLDDLVRDTRLAWRSLSRAGGFTVVAVLVLALGIGVVSGAFSLLNAMYLKSVLIEEPERVVSVFAVHSEHRTGRMFSYPEYVQLRERAETFSSLAAYNFFETGVEEGGLTRSAQTVFVSAGYFETFGVPLAQGREFTLAEERGEEATVVVVSHDFWVRNGADPNLVGSIVRVNGIPLDVVGIAARGFTGTTAMGVDVWLPLGAMDLIRPRGIGDRRNLQNPQSRSLLLFGRLEQDTSLTEAEAELATLATRVDTNVSDPGDGRYTYVVGDLQRFSMSPAPNPDQGPTIEVLMPFAMTAIVLAVACLNLANMFLARGVSRRTEMAIRQSLGSGRSRLIRQLLTEALMLALLGGVVGLMWSYWATSWIAGSLARFVPQGLTIAIDTRPDARVLLVTAATCVAATLLFGLGPAWRVTGPDVLSGLKEGDGAMPFSRRRRRALPSGKSLMIVAQIALSLVMLSTGGLFLRSALAAANATPSFSLDSTLLVELNASLAGYDEARTRNLYSRVMERLRALPEVEHAGMASLVPFSGRIENRPVQAAGLPADESSHDAYYSVIGEAYFDALRLPILRGRDFTQAEVTSNTGPRVAIVDEPLARLLFPDSEAVGRLIQLASLRPGAGPTETEVVGIVPGTPGGDFDPAARPHVYVPFGQAGRPHMNVLLAVSEQASSAGVLGRIRSEIRAIDPSLPVLQLTTMGELRGQNWFLRLSRIGAYLFTLLGVLALFVAMVGLYGVRAFLMSRRTREIGVRMALGATRGDVLRQMMRESLALTVAGIGVGLILTLIAGQILSSLLYEVSATDPWALLGASMSLALAAVVASWLPVRQALRIEPSAALRHE